MFVTAILFNETEPERMKVLVLIYIHNGGHQWTYDNFCMVQNVDLQIKQTEM